MIMPKKIVLLTIALAVLGAAITTGQTSSNILPDGLALSGVDGKLIATDKGYSFRTDTEITEDKFTIKAETTLEILPSAGLEKMITNSKKDPNAGYRLWGKIATYQGRNFIYLVHFLPFSEDLKDKTSEAQNVSAINEQGGSLTIPKEILEKLTTKKVIQPIQIEAGFALKQDQMLVDRTGFIVKRPDDSFSFVLDGLGRNVPNTSLKLLSCQMLEKTLQMQTTESELMRLSAAGIVTRYKGEDYLMLQRASRVYSYGNFPK